MQKNAFFSTYLKFFSFLAKIIVLFLFCAVFALLVVTPLWKFSVSNPSLYSITAALIGIILILVVCIKKVRSFVLTTPKDEQKRKIANSIRLFVLLLLLCASIALFVLLVMNGSRLFGILSLIIGLILYGIVSFAYKRK